MQYNNPYFNCMMTYDPRQGQQIIEGHMRLFFVKVKVKYVSCQAISIQLLQATKDIQIKAKSNRILFISTFSDNMNLLLES